MDARTGYERRCGNRGFTLIELIIASSLISIVLLGAYSTFHAVVRNWRGAEDTHAQMFSDARAVKDRLTQDIRSIPTARVNGIPDRRYYFVGDRSGLEFLTMNVPMNVELEPHRQLLKVEYRLRRTRGGSGEELVRTEWPVVGPYPRGSLVERVNRDKLELGRPREFVVAQNISNLQLEYLWPPTEDETGNGQLDLVRSGIAYESVPKGVSIALEFHEPGADYERQYTSLKFVVVVPGEASPIPQEWRTAGNYGDVR